jgi:hypothetical protein
MNLFFLHKGLMSFGGGNIGFSDWCQKQACLYRSNGFGGKKTLI